MSTARYIAYYRVSTDKQGRSGLGLEAQRRAVVDYLNGGNWELVEEFTEIESGKKNDRPELAKALAACRKHKAKLVIARLDRLSRNAAFIGNMMESNVEFVAVDFPSASRLTLHILAAVADYEREAISTRTKAALAAKKAQGVKLGGPRLDLASVEGVKAVKAKADQFAANVLPIVRSIEASGITTFDGIAAALNARGVRTARGGQWYGATVRNIVMRSGAGEGVQ